MGAISQRYQVYAGSVSRWDLSNIFDCLILTNIHSNYTKDPIISHENIFPNPLKVCLAYESQPDRAKRYSPNNGTRRYCGSPRRGGSLGIRTIQTTIQNTLLQWFITAMSSANPPQIPETQSPRQLVPSLSQHCRLPRLVRRIRLLDQELRMIPRHDKWSYAPFEVPAPPRRYKPDWALQAEWFKGDP